MRVLLALLVLSTLPALADGDAKTLYDQGTALFALHKFAAAAEAYERAFEKRPDPAILYNAAQAHRLAGNKARALELYESLQKLYGDKLSNHVEIANHIRALRRAIEADTNAASAPPVTPLQAQPPEAPPVEPPSQPPPSVVVVEKPAASPPPPKQKKWIWGVVGGAAALVVAGVVVGVVIGTEKTVAPKPSIGTVPGN